MRTSRFFHAFTLVALGAALTLAACTAAPPGTRPADAGQTRSAVGPHLALDGGVVIADAGPTCHAQTNQYTPSIWQPPAPPHANACTEQQAVLIAHCMAVPQEQGEQGCVDFWNNTANSTCIACATSDWSANPRRAFYGDDTDGFYPNTEGCVAVATNDSSSAGCGARLLSLTECEYGQCLHCTDQAGYSNCILEADQGACKAYAGALTCASPYIDDPTAPCNGKDNFDFFMKLMRLFCLP